MIRGREGERGGGRGREGEGGGERGREGANQDALIILT